MKYTLGHINPWWTDEHTSLPYIINSPIDPKHSALWNSQGYDSKLNTCHVYSCKDDLPDWAIPFGEIFPEWKNKGYNFMKMRMCELLPAHSDTYTKYRTVFNLTDTDTICRTVVFMDDWKSGHYFEIDGEPLVGWKKGDWVSWTNDTAHYAGNIGLENRYTLQITGHL